MPYSAGPRVPMISEHASRIVTSMTTSSLVHRLPASLLSLEQHHDRKDYYLKEEKVSQATLDKQKVGDSKPPCEENEEYEFGQYLEYFQRQLISRPGLWPQPTINKENTTSIMSKELTVHHSNSIKVAESIQLGNSPDSLSPAVVLSLAKKAMMATRKATLLAQKSNILSAVLDEQHFSGVSDKEFSEEISIKKGKIVKSKRLLERRSKKRKASKSPSSIGYEVASLKSIDISKKIDKRLDSNDPLKLLEGVKQRLELQFGREPTLAEWARSVGMSCQVLQTCLCSGRRSREKIIYANFRLVIHVAKQYEGKGLSLQDLLQEGSRGLIKSLEKFKPQAGCRFSSYAYWWIRQSIRKAIFQHSRTIRLPENVFGLLRKVKAARKLYIQGGYLPANEEIAKCVGITSQKLESLLLRARNPVPIRKRVWTDQDVTLQEITADPEVEIPDLNISKAMMREHVRDFLGILNPRRGK
ncbi:RNA polymerase sigma factor sigF, chloroplastic [Ananas comosus]|uniref:RNA polymerase sigma factor sigF, chloroplastic n=1 Tax=Ananas comosus TaxID=4615 RepID=A0A199VKX4_ANACO|nr:RNA polymerase sigma factor sigF, chloroplastic [Ananas comosus]